MSGVKTVTTGKGDKIPPRERILAVAGELFYRHGIRAVGVEAIAEAAGTNKMTLYRHFDSKDELVAEYLRKMAMRANECWDRFMQSHSRDALAQLRTWLVEMAGRVADPAERGCALTNAAVELPEKDHPGRRVIEEFKKGYRARLAGLARAAGLDDPEMLADELGLMVEGARVESQNVASDVLGDRVVRIGEALIAAHTPKRR
jgi:AcrR family transcriptional regulator